MFECLIDHTGTNRGRPAESPLSTCKSKNCLSVRGLNECWDAELARSGSPTERPTSEPRDHPWVRYALKTFEQFDRGL